MRRFGALVLVAVTFFLSAYTSRTVFERLPHLEDELAYLYQARVFAGGQVVVDTPQPSGSFWQPFVVDYEGKRFSKYAPGWSGLLALGVLMGAPWWVNAAFAALTVALVYRTGAELFNADTGLIAAGLVTFSPMAILLNGSLMSHTSALFSTALFTYAFWRVERGRNAVRWGLLAGLALGLLLVNRPLTAIGVAAPFVVYALARLLGLLVRQRERLAGQFAALVALGLVTLVLAPLVPLYRYIATGDPLFNTYTLVWDYDRVGFGDDYGRYGHTLRKGLRHAREDLTLTASDLFGWQFGGLTYEQRYHLLLGTREYPGRGCSWVLLPLGMVAGLLLKAPRRRWTLMLAAVPAAVIAVHLAYWIGSQRYSTRYYYEGLAGAALLAAVFPGWLAARGRWARAVVYGLLVVVTGYTALTYTLPRVRVLHRFNNVSGDHIAQLDAIRQTDKPVLVLLSGDGMTWRANGTLMALTSPYLNSDVVLARDRADGRYRERILALFPEREVVDMYGVRSKSWFALHEFGMATEQPGE